MKEWVTTSWAPGSAWPGGAHRGVEEAWVKPGEHRTKPGWEQTWDVHFQETQKPPPPHPADLCTQLSWSLSSYPICPICPGAPRPRPSPITITPCWHPFLPPSQPSTQPTLPGSLCEVRCGRGQDTGCNASG